MISNEYEYLLNIINRANPLIQMFKNYNPLNRDSNANSNKIMIFTSRSC